MRIQGLMIAVLLSFFSLCIQAEIRNFSQTPRFPNSLSGKHFFIEVVSAPKIKNHRHIDLVAPKNCRDHIQKVICLVDPVKEDEKGQPRKCLPGGEKYAVVFEGIHDQFPSVLQKTFCSLRHLYIEKEFIGTAYAAVRRTEEGQLNGAIMGIRQSVIDEKLNLTTWASWKEQLSFGGISDSYTLTPGLPQIQTQSQTAANDFLYFVIAHEFGHMLDFANDVNKLEDKTCGKNDPENGPYEECKMDQESWAGFSWMTNKNAWAHSDFTLRPELCFYWCNGKFIGLEKLPETYLGLAQTDFISTYAATNPWDDFADSLAYFVMSLNFPFSYVIQIPNGSNYNIIEKLHSHKFTKKYDYLKNFVERNDLIYP